MSTFILDCSITIGWCFEDEKDSYSMKVLDSFKKAKALVPYLWNYEVSNVLITSLKKRKITQAACSKFLQYLNKLPIEASDRKCDMQSLVTISEKYNLTAYDGAYLELGIFAGCALATNDKQLALAAKEAGVPLYLK